jgi:hypothetical protein
MILLRTFSFRIFKRNRLILCKVSPLTCSQLKYWYFKIAQEHLGDTACFTALERIHIVNNGCAATSITVSSVLGLP